MTDFPRLTTQRRSHSVHGSKEIHQQRRGGSLGALEQQRGSLFSKDALRNLRRFEFRIYFNTNSFKLAALFEISKKILQIIERHGDTDISSDACGIPSFKINLAPCFPVQIEGFS